MKLINGAVITKCGECRNYAKFGLADCHLTKNIIFADKSGFIDPSCPLQDVEVIDKPNKYYTIKTLAQQALRLINNDDIDYIVIVKKAQGVKE